jgi:cysteine desulfurase/selenocysteine lyase
MIGPKTKVVAATGMSNVTGYMPPVAELFKRGRAVGAITVLDAAQLASHHRLDLSDGLIDFVSFSSHKMCGPTGVGVLVGSKELLDSMEPLIYGGDMISRVRKSGTTFKEAPDRFEAGTPNIAGVFGLSAAVDYLEGIGLEAIAEHERMLLSYAEERAQDYPDIIRYGSKDLSKRGGIFSFNVEGVHSHDVGTILDSEGIAVRTGMHCAHPYMQVLCIPGTTRASFYFYNTVEEVDRLFEGIDRVRRVFG